MFFHSTIQGDPRECSGGAKKLDIIDLNVNTDKFCQDNFNILQIHLSYEIDLSSHRFNFENANKKLREPDNNVKNKRSHSIKNHTNLDSFSFHIEIK